MEDGEIDPGSEVVNVGDEAAGFPVPEELVEEAGPLEGAVEVAVAGRIPPEKQY